MKNIVRSGVEPVAEAFKWRSSPKLEPDHAYIEIAKLVEDWPARPKVKVVDLATATTTRIKCARTP